MFNKIFGSGNTATTETPTSNTVASAPVTAPPVNNVISTNSAVAATDMAANPGSIQNPIAINTPNFEVVTEEKLASLPEDQKAVINRFVGSDSESIALSSGDSIAVLASGPNGQKQAFNKGILNKAFVKLGMKPDNKFGIKWMKDALPGSQENDSVFFESPKHVVSSMKSGDYRSLMIFKKGQDGKYTSKPELIALVDDLSKLPEAVTSSKVKLGENQPTLGEIAANVKAIPQVAQSFLLDQIILNPESNSAKDSKTAMPQLMQEVSEAFFKAETALAAKLNPEKKVDGKQPAAYLFFPNIKTKTEYASSANLKYDTFSSYQAPVQKKDTKEWSAQAQALTKVSPKTTPRNIHPDIAYAMAWDQLSMGGEFPSKEEVVKDLAMTLPKKNAEMFAAFNGNIMPRVNGIPASTPSVPVTGMAA